VELEERGDKVGDGRELDVCAGQQGQGGRRRTAKGGVQQVDGELAHKRGVGLRDVAGGDERDEALEEHGLAGYQLTS